MSVVQSSALPSPNSGLMDWGEGGGGWGGGLSCVQTVQNIDMSIIDEVSRSVTWFLLGEEFSGSRAHASSL
jgi:hypothetical protein